MTTRRDSTIDAIIQGVGFLITLPAVLAAVAGAAVVGELGLPGGLRGPMVVAVAVCAGLVAAALHVTGITPRVRRALVDCGVVHRASDGSVHGPLPRGRARHDGSTVVTRWALPPGVSVADVVRRQDAVGERCNAEAVCWGEDGLLVVELLRHRIPPVVPFDDFHRAAAPDGSLVVGLGVGRRGPLWVDLAVVPHLLVGGVTGGGKSVFLRQAVTGLALRNDPDRLQLLAIDLKGGVELAGFGRLPHSLGPVVDTAVVAADALGAVRGELDRRLSVLRAAGARDLDGLVAAGLAGWPRVLVVVDELAELTLRDLGEDRAARDAQRAAIGRLCEIARLGRAAGIHLIACTQRPDADAVPGQLKANLPGTVAFRVRSRVNSEILLDCDRAALLPHRPGRALWAHDRVEEFQAVHITADEAELRLRERFGSGAHAGATGRVTPWRQSPLVNSLSGEVPGTSRGACRGPADSPQ